MPGRTVFGSALPARDGIVRLRRSGLPGGRRGDRRGLEVRGPARVLGGVPTLGQGSLDALAGVEIVLGRGNVTARVRHFTEVGVRAEGGRIQKPAQAGGGTQRWGCVYGCCRKNLRRPESDS